MPALSRLFYYFFAAQKIFDFCSTYVLPARANSTLVLFFSEKPLGFLLQHC
jgi:hypothetical protein